MKVIKKLESSAEKELSLIWRISHENILKYFQHRLDDDHTCIINEYCHVSHYNF